MLRLRVRRKAYKRKSYVRKDGTRVKASSVPSSSFVVKDRGDKGRTPKSRQFFHPKVKTGWKKDMPATKRRSLMLRAHKGDKLSAGRGAQALANVTTDRETKVAARADAKYFFGALK